MSYICQKCGKETVVGGSQRHGRGVAGKRWKFRAPHTKRTFQPNLQKISILVAGKKVQMLLCTKCIKRLKKDKKV
jgi:ribosomal protein L28